MAKKPDFLDRALGEASRVFDMTAGWPKDIKKRVEDAIPLLRSKELKLLTVARFLRQDLADRQLPTRCEDHIARYLRARVEAAHE